MSEEAAGARAVRRLAWRVWAATVGANAIAAAAVGLIVWMYTPLFPGTVTAGRRLGAILAIGFGFFSFAALVALMIAHRIAARAANWLAEERAPDPRELARFARIPRAIVLVTVSFWVVGGIATVALFVLMTRYRILGTAQYIGLALTYAYPAVAGAVGSYLLAERQLRPVLRGALGDDLEHWPRAMGVRARLLLAWLVVAGAPLVMIGYFSVGPNLIPFPLDPDDLLRHNAIALTVSCLLAVVIGLAVFAFAGRAITLPLKRLQDGLRHVASGDLTAEVEVGEAGEIGLLQTGFNQMVRGLQERERMRDLFGRHVGVEVARQAMTREATLGGERREASAMFVDVIASTHLAQTRPAEDVVQILNTFFDAVVRAVGDEEGIINKFAGDGVLCVFGAPSDQPDHAARALRAARRLKEKLEPLDSVEAAIGVSSGAVVAGNVGAMDRYEYTIIGDPVNEAARLTEQAKTKPSRVLASAEAVFAADDERENWKLGETLRLRGRAEPTVTYEPRS